jgi:hypothetical protein
MSKVKIPYYAVKHGRGYWQPTKRMKDLGLMRVACGPDGPAAWAIAERQNATWRSIWRGEQKPKRMNKDGLREGYVYFLRSNGRVKIGYSKNPFQRSSELRTGMSAQIDSFVAVPGSLKDEGKLHQRLMAYRTQGEWFVDSDVVSRTIMRAAAFGKIVHDQAAEGKVNKQSEKTAPPAIFPTEAL